MNNLPVYSAIAVVGLTISFLYYSVDDNASSAYLLLFVTVYVLASLRFVLEWEYYRQHRAILASSQFLLLPFIILLMGSIVAYRIDSYVLLNFQILLQSMHLVFTINLISLTLLLPLIVLHRLFYFYHAKRWLGFAIHRKLFQSRLVPFLLNILLVTIQIYLMLRLGIADGVASIFILSTIVFVFKYYILVKFKSSSPMRAVDSALYNSDTTRIPPSSGVQIEPSNRTTHRNSSRNIPTLPRNGLRTVSARGSNPRTISSRSNSPTTRARNSSPTGSRTSSVSPSASSRRQRKSNATVAPGREINAIKEQPKKITAASNLIPTGHVSKSDLKCIVCFDEIHANDKPIILCPHCKYPCHEDEFIAWSTSSNLCARCSKPISKAYVKNPKYHFSARDYVTKVINKL